MTSSSEQQQQLEFDPDILERWREVGSDRGLTSDALIAKFLVEQYENQQRGVKQGLCCLKCDGPLSLLCARCDFAGWSTQSHDSTSLLAPQSTGTAQQSSATDSITEVLSAVHSFCQKTHTSSVLQTVLSADPNSSATVNKSTTVLTSGADVNLFSPTAPSTQSSGGCCGAQQVKVEAEDEVTSTGNEPRNKNDSVARPSDSNMETCTHGARRKRTYPRKSVPATSQQPDHKLSTEFMKTGNIRLREVSSESNRSDNITQAVQQCFPCAVKLNDTASTHTLLTNTGKRRHGKNDKLRRASQCASRFFPDKLKLNHSDSIVKQTDTSAGTQLVDSENTFRDETSNMGEILEHASHTDSVDEVTVHFNDAHKTEIRKSADVEQTVKKQGFSKLQNMAKSIQNSSGKKSLQTSSLKNSKCSVVEKKNSVNKKTYNCEECGATYLQPQGLKYHIMGEHRGERPFVCETCGKSYLRQTDLHRHTMQRHTGERPYKCSQCVAAFAVKSSLTAHLETHASEKTHVCHICGADFRQKNSLRQHLPIHSKEKPHKCPECDLTFSQRGNMLIHLRTHTGEKPYQCSHCGRRFRGNSTLRTHMMTHTGQKPYSCPDCEKTFVSSSALRVHHRVHTGDKPYTCSVCQTGFQTSDILRRHMMVHTGERPHICVECGQAFSRSDHLKKHMKTRHSYVQKASKPVVTISHNIPVLAIKMS